MSDQRKAGEVRRDPLRQGDAAPALLAACKLLLAKWDRYEADEDLHVFVDDVESTVLPAARAAVAQARAGLTPREEPSDVTSHRR